MRNRDELLKQLKHTDADHRHTALVNLGQVSEDWIFPHVIECFGDTDWRVRKAAVEIVIKRPSGEIISLIIPALRDGDNAGRRNAALDALCQIGTQVIEHLRLLINDADDDVRKFAVDTLGEIGKRQTVPLLIAFLADHDENVRAAAVEYLGKIGDFRAIGPLLALLDEKKFWLSYAIIVALGDLKNPKAIPSLFELLADETLLPSVIMAIGKIPGLGAAERLFSFLTHPRDNIRKISLKALVQIGEMALKAFYLKDEHKSLVTELFFRTKNQAIEDFALESLSSSDFQLKRAAVIALGWMKVVRAREQLLDTFDDERLSRETQMTLIALGTDIVPYLVDNIENEDERIRIAIASVLGQIGDYRAEKSLIKRLTDDIGHVRAAAAMALKQLQSYKSIPHLVKLLADEYPDVREAAVIALDGLDKQEILTYTAHLLEDSGSPMKEAVVKVYCAAVGPEKIDSLLFLLKSESPVVRKTVVDRLRSFESESVIEALQLALTDEHPDVRIAASKALSFIRHPKSLEGLTQAIRDKNMWVTNTVIQALGNLGFEEAIELLIEKLQDERTVIQITALQALANFPQPRVSELLSTRVRDSSLDLEVRRTSAIILGRLGNPEVVPILLELLDEPDWNFRYSIIEALSQLEHRAIIEPLMAIIRHDGGVPLIRQASVKALEKNHNPAVVSLLISLLQDQDEKIVETAFHILHHLHPIYQDLIDHEAQNEDNRYNWLLDYLK